MVRISGPSAFAAVEALAGRLPRPRRAGLRTLRHAGHVLDEALILRFPGPGNATGEDLAELHLHGGRAVVAAVLDALSAQPGLRAAEPGEFTRRAFANGRIDLAEAEGLADLLAAETEHQRRAALANAGGALSRRVADWTARLLVLAAAIEARLDFSDEGDVEDGLPPAWSTDLAALRNEMAAMLARPPAERLRDGIRVVLAGPPNAGKSSLFNAIAGREAAIVSDMAGTTRDVIEAPLAIHGIPFLLVDTAGLRDSRDEVEALGIARARDRVAEADIVLWLGPPDIRPGGANVIQLHPKADIGPPSPGFAVSARTGLGLADLADLLADRAKALLPRMDEATINRRQRSCLLDAWSALAACEGQGDMLILAESLRLTRSALDRVTGRAGVEDMLDTLFGRFCIGK